MFVVRYDAGKRTHLANHTDAGCISFNVLLNDGFEGGGTRFWNRWTQEPFAYVNPSQVGQVLLNHATINHEGVHVSNGTRTILVGFLSVDRVDPFTRRPTNLSWFASWGSISWSTVKFKAGFDALLKSKQHGTSSGSSWMNSKYIRGFFGNMHMLLNGMLDCFETHFARKFVADRDREAYLAALDDHFALRGQQTDAHDVNWWKGQQVKVNFDGQITQEADVRSDHTATAKLMSDEL
jgi:hypothetical protein